MAERYIVNWTTEDGLARRDTFIDLPSMPRDCYGAAVPLPYNYHLCVDARHAVDLFRSRLRGTSVEEYVDPQVTP